MFGFGSKNSAIDAFAHEICVDLCKRFPPSREVELGGDKKKLGLKLGNALAEMQKRVVAFQLEHDLGVYGKARLLRSIQEEMEGLAYSASMVSAVTELLVTTPANETK